MVVAVRMEVVVAVVVLRRRCRAHHHAPRQQQQTAGRASLSSHARTPTHRLSLTCQAAASAKAVATAVEVASRRRPTHATLPTLNAVIVRLPVVAASDTAPREQ